MVNDLFMSNVQGKTNHSDAFFSQWCEIDSIMCLSTELTINETIIVKEQRITKLSSNSNPNKAHSHDGLSIPMLQV